ncbi:heme-binding protein 2-like [Apostichopus japonicus]|uniref:heme-binding protein 2-like n=1 Tax=Stichopus japonicus TaxID=307972 RepID=UPI003AB85707
MAPRQFTMLITVLVVTVTVASAKPMQARDEPTFCKGLDCPDFQPTGSGEDYEVRAYSSAKWVSTQVIDLSYDKAVKEGFELLFKYISGANKPGLKVPMTAPVTTRVIPAPGPACENNFTVSFFVPFADQDNPPMPSNDKVFISPLQEFTAYVRVFHGFAKQEDWIANAEALKNSLANTTATYDKSFYYTAGYDSPFTIFSRHNEVWFFAT